MTTKHFYQNLRSFNLFETTFDKACFTPVPEEWIVIITDIRSSTEAIESGKYRDVNTVGAASIVVAHNALKDLPFPYVFGGDGATMIIPPEYEETIGDEFSALQQLSQINFNLDLRVGKITVKEIIKAGGAVDVAKYSLTSKKSIAFFRGGGLYIAEKKIKSDESQYCIAPQPLQSLNLEKLSCRWKPIPSKQGKILSLIVLSRKQPQTAVYHEILSTFKAFYSGDLDAANPVKQSQLSYKSLLDSIKNEKKLHDKSLSFEFLKRLGLILLSSFLFKFHFLQAYRQSLTPHSDYRKFDDMLRMVIDCDERQAILINKHLDKLYQQGKIYYGIHTSKDVLMTCFVDSLADGEHIHFIDGGDGGYAMAAKQLKKQIRSTSSNQRRNHK